MSDSNQERYLDIFLEEASEQIDNLNESLLRLEKEGAQDGIINELFRSAHTLKSAAAFVGFDRLSALSHSMEDLLQKVRDDELQISTELANLFFQIVDRIRSFLSKVSAGQEAPEEFDDLTQAIESYAAGGGSVAQSTSEQKLADPPPAAPAVTAEPAGAAAPAESSPPAASTASASGGDKMEFIQLSAEEEEELRSLAGSKNIFDGCVRLDRDSAMKNMRYLLLFENLKREANLFRSHPGSEALEGDEDIEALRFIVYGDIDRAKLAAVCQVDMVEEVRLAEHAVPGAARRRQDMDSGQESRIQSKNIKVSSEKIDYLMNNVGELVIINSGLQKIYEDMQTNMGESAALSELKNKIDQAERIARDLQSGIMKTRMIPVGLVFHRFTRPVRDLSLEMNKDVELEFHGEDTELDKNIIDALSEPLLHLLRNSMDHGIESAEERAKTGKPPAAKLALNSYQSGNNIIIEVSDDGRGLNRQRIFQQAVKKGLVNPDADLRDEEVYDLIFHSGFSTADAVTDISGRGVGMNVVKKMVEDFKGNVQIVSTPGQGTTFLLSFPLTLAIFSAIIVSLKDEEYAFPLADVVETIKVSQDEITSLQGRDIINLRGDILPVFHLGEIMGFPPEEEVEEFPVLIAMSANRKVGFIVDGLNGKREIVIKSLEQNFKSVRGLIGASIMGDGRIIMVVDVQGLLDMTQRRGLKELPGRQLEEVHDATEAYAAVQAYNERVAELIEQQRQSAMEWEFGFDEELAEERRKVEAQALATGVAAGTSAPAPAAIPADSRAGDSRDTSRMMRDEMERRPDSGGSGRADTIPARPVAPMPGEAAPAAPAPEKERAAPLRELSEEDYQKLFSLISTGMTNAGGVLSQLLGVKVEVSVPEFKTMEYSDLRGHMPKGGLLASAVEAEEGMDAVVLLVFDETTGYQAAGDLMGVPQEQWGPDGISDEDLGSVLMELINIVGASVLNEMSNKTGLTITPTVPEFRRGDSEKIVQWIDEKEGKGAEARGLKVLYITADFFRQDLEFLGRLFMIPSSRSLARVVNKL